jgi:hypothetical protein
MNHMLTRKWIAIAIIWAGILIITLMNTQTIGQIRHVLTSAEILEKDEAFLRSKFDIIAQDLRQYAALSKPIDSLQIELLSLENQLRSLAQKENLIDFDMVSDITAQQDNRISLEINLVGDFKDILFWLTAVDKGMTYLRITDIHMAKKLDAEAYAYSVKLDFRFKLAAASDQ